jgi:hypothetical protein
MSTRKINPMTAFTLTAALALAGGMPLSLFNHSSTSPTDDEERALKEMERGAADIWRRKFGRGLTKEEREFFRDRYVTETSDEVQP